MYEIQFYVNPEANKDPDFESWLARRLSYLIEGNPTFIRTDDIEARRFNLGMSNDWWLYLPSADMPRNKFRLAYRYGGGHIDKMLALKTVILWRLGIGQFNDPDVEGSITE